MSTPQIDKLQSWSSRTLDYGKTTLVDKLLQQSGTLGVSWWSWKSVSWIRMTSKERGITILAKNTAINWNDYRINIVDILGTRGTSAVKRAYHVYGWFSSSDRRCSDGPMPQILFLVTGDSRRPKPIVVINKIDRPGARPDCYGSSIRPFRQPRCYWWATRLTVVYASALNGWATMEKKAQLAQTWNHCSKLLLIQ